MDILINHWCYIQLRNRLTLADVEHAEAHRADIAEISVRCELGYVAFRYQPNMIYELADKGGCWLTFIGNRVTRFRLVELGSAE